MKSLRVFLSIIGLAVAVTLGTGCATAQKRTTPVVPELKNELLKELDKVAEQPELEPEWADYVKDRYPNWRRHYWVDRGQWGNRGYIVGKMPAAADAIKSTQIEMPPEPPVIVNSDTPKIDTPEKPTKYVVKKGDSLWRISGKVYGNPLKWPRIYKANKDKIKNPHKIYPNQVLVIPQD